MGDGSHTEHELQRAALKESAVQGWHSAALFHHREINLALAPTLSKSAILTVEACAVPLDAFLALVNFTTFSFGATVLLASAAGLGFVFCFALLLRFNHCSDSESVQAKGKNLSARIQQVVDMYQTLESHGANPVSISEQPLVLTPCEQRWMLARSSGSGALYGFTFFNSFYVGVYTLLPYLGYKTLAASMGGPVGLAAMALVTLVLTGVVGYMVYKQNKDAAALEHFEKRIDSARDQNIELFNTKFGAPELVAQGEAPAGTLTAN